MVDEPTVSGAGEVYFDSISMLALLLLGARFLEAEADGVCLANARLAIELAFGLDRRLETLTCVTHPRWN